MHIIAEVRWHIQAQADLDAQRISHLEHDTLIKANERLRQKGSKATNKKKKKTYALTNYVYQVIISCKKCLQFKFCLYLPCMAQ